MNENVLISDLKYGNDDLLLWYFCALCKTAQQQAFSLFFKYASIFRITGYRLDD